MEHNRSNGQNPQLPVLIQPNIGLDSEVRHSVVALLNVTLADEMVLTTKTRSACWNAHGANYLELHRLFAAQYPLLDNITDEIAERTRILGGFATGSLAEFLQMTRLEERPGVVPDVLSLLADYETSIRFLREDSRKCSEEYEDAGTSDLLVGLMRLHEKLAWTLRAYIEAEPQNDHQRNSA